MTKPLRPDEVYQAKLDSISDEVFDIFNAAILKSWNSYSATVIQSEVLLEISVALGITTQEVFDRGYLNIEDVYRVFDWYVVYDKPGYNEDYPATFTFTRRI